MANYIVGDIQGCFDELDLLLRQIHFDHQNDHLYLVGDLIGRGPQAKETLDFLINHQSSIHPVLGNHDLHFLAISQGVKTAKPNDKYDALLASDRLCKYIEYLRALPLVIHLAGEQVIISHAGITPQWDLATALEQAKKVEQWLQSDNYPLLLSAMYNNDINNWTHCHTSLTKAIFTINSLTRMRYCFSNQSLEFKTNCAPQNNNTAQLIPWFKLDNQFPHGYRLIFGHWASLLGKTDNNKFIALDTGCLWGGNLTALQLHSNKYFQQRSLQKLNK